MAMLYTPFQGVVTMQDGATATGNGTSMPTLDGSNGASSYMTVQVTGISADTITFEATIDGTNWVAVKFTNLTSGTAATTAAADGLYQSTTPVLGLVSVRARISTYGAGTIVVKGVATG